jgi:hypothetical protein
LPPPPPTPITLMRVPWSNCSIISIAMMFLSYASAVAVQ